MDRQKQLKYLKSLPDEAIDFSDIAEVTDYKAWEPNPFYRAVKTQLSAKIDKDIMAWLKMHGEVSRFLNKVLREKMLEERHHHA